MPQQLFGRRHRHSATGLQLNVNGSIRPLTEPPRRAERPLLLDRSSLSPGARGTLVGGQLTLGRTRGRTGDPVSATRSQPHPSSPRARVCVAEIHPDDRFPRVLDVVGARQTRHALDEPGALP